MGSSLACFGARGLSDHNPIILSTGISHNKIFKPFQFFNHLILMEGYAEVVSQAWNCQISGSPIFILAEKLRRTKRALIAFNKQHGSTSTNIQLARQALHALQMSIQLSDDPISSDKLDLHWKLTKSYGMLLPLKSNSSFKNPEFNGSL